LSKFGKFFGLASGADVLVYGSILVLGYFYFEILHKITKDNLQFTKLVTNEALSHIDSDYIKSKATSNQLPATSPSNEIKAGNWELGAGSLRKSDFMFHIKGLNEERTIGKVIDEII
jgi:hypothetical protein